MNLIEQKIQKRKILLISKSNSPNCKQIERLLLRYNLNNEKYDTFEILHINERKDCEVIESALWHKLIYRCRQVPHLFIDGVHIGGETEIIRLHESDDLKKIFIKAGVLSDY